MLTSSHQLLLKAALLPTDEALRHWQTWQNQNESSANPMDALDSDGYRLLPLIYRNLEFTADPLLPQLKAIYLSTWKRNNKFLQTLYPVLQGLQAEGCEMMLIKGISMALQYYKDLGVRPVGDIDMMVPFDQVDEALAILRRPEFDFKPTRFEVRHRRLLHAMHLFNGENQDIDLHWHLLYHHTYSGADQPFWADKQIIQLPNGQRVFTLSATHQIFHNLIHGFRWDDTTALRWIPDTYCICRSHASIDWQALLDLAERYQMRIPVRQGLSLLQSLLGLELPPAVIARLSVMVPTPQEDAYFRLLPSVANPVHKAARSVQKYYFGHRLFLRGRGKFRLSAYVLRRLHYRLEWPYSGLYKRTQLPSRQSTPNS